MDAFEYTGRAYVRPVGRGICLIDPTETVPGVVATPESQLESLLDEGFWEVEIRARRLTAEEVKKAEADWRD